MNFYESIKKDSEICNKRHEDCKGCEISTKCKKKYGLLSPTRFLEITNRAIKYYKLEKENNQG